MAESLTVMTAEVTKGRLAWRRAWRGATRAARSRVRRAAYTGAKLSDPVEAALVAGYASKHLRPSLRQRILSPACASAAMLLLLFSSLREGGVFAVLPALLLVLCLGAIGFYLWSEPRLLRAREENRREP